MLGLKLQCVHCYTTKGPRNERTDNRTRRIETHSSTETHADITHATALQQVAGRLLDVNRYLIWVRINAYQTANTIVYAHNDYQARQLAEAQYGIGSVLNYTLLDD